LVVALGEVLAEALTLTLLALLGAEVVAQEVLLFKLDLQLQQQPHTQLLLVAAVQNYQLEQQMMQLGILAKIHQLMLL
jgi:hypothetical protein